MPSLIIAAEAAAGEPVALSHDRRAFQLKERVTASDVSPPHVAVQLIHASAGRSSTPRRRRSTG
jgi:hypothetical protein